MIEKQEVKSTNESTNKEKQGTRKKSEQKVVSKRFKESGSALEKKTEFFLSPDSTVDDVVSTLKARFSSSVDLSQVECKDWINYLPLGSTVNCLLVKGQELKTKQDILPLSVFAQNTTTLKDLHLEDNKLEWECLFPFLPLLLDEKRNPPLKLYLSGNPLIPGKQFKSLSLVPRREIRCFLSCLTNFQTMPEEEIFFASFS